MRVEVYTTEERDALLGIVPGPRWKDCCEHAKESYVATFELLVGAHPDWKLEAYDLYVFEQRGRSEVCLRFGDEPGDYISPGNVGQFCRTTGANFAGAPEYARAYDILQHFGTFHWKKTPTTKDPT